MAEDDHILSAFLVKRLRNYGQVTQVHSGTETLIACASVPFDLLILDICLPQQSGLEVLQRLRADNNRVQVIVITEADIATHEKESFRNGADLFHSKPLDLELLTLQVESVLRRHALPEAVALGELKLVSLARMLVYGERQLHLTQRETDILLALAVAEGRPRSRAQLRRGRYTHSAAADNAVDAAVSRLRRKLQQVRFPDILENVYGIGYRLRLS